MKQFLIKITIFVVTSLYLNCQAPNKPYSFKNSIFNLKEISEIELLETNTPDFQSINKYIDSIDIRTYYILNFMVPHLLDILRNWKFQMTLSKSKGKQTEIHIYNNHNSIYWL